MMMLQIVVVVVVVWEFCLVFMVLMMLARCEERGVGGSAQSGQVAHDIITLYFAF